MVRTRSCQGTSDTPDLFRRLGVPGQI
jgi:hypothetical protein